MGLISIELGQMMSYAIQRLSAQLSDRVEDMASIKPL